MHTVNKYIYFGTSFIFVIFFLFKGNLNQDKSDSLRKHISQLWKIYFFPADQDGNGNVSCNELANHIRACLGDETKRATIRETLPLIFDAIDSDRDENVSRIEFANYFKSLNIKDQGIADQVFNAMVKNLYFYFMVY